MIEYIQELPTCGNKRIIVVNLTVSTNRPDTSGITTPDTVPTFTIGQPTMDEAFNTPCTLL